MVGAEVVASAEVVSLNRCRKQYTKVIRSCRHAFVHGRFIAKHHELS